MGLAFAHQRGNEIVEHVPRYSSPDHAVNFAALIRFIGRRPRSPFYPYFLEPLVIDPLVEHVLRDEIDNLMLEDMQESVRKGYWLVEDTGNAARIVLAEPLRRSALHLFSNRAAYMTYTPAQRRAMRGTSIRLALAMENAELGVFEESSPVAWREFEPVGYLRDGQFTLLEQSGRRRDVATGVGSAAVAGQGRRKWVARLPPEVALLLRGRSCRLGGKEAAPGEGGATWRGRDAVLTQDPSDRVGRDVQAELAELALRRR